MAAESSGGIPRHGHPIEFKILGPVEALAGTERLQLGGPRQQIVLAMLLLSANTVVTTDRLLEAIYGEDLPPTSRSQVQICISWLRRLFASHDRAETISTRANGYVIDVGEDGLDSVVFEKLLTAARTAADAGHLVQAATSYRDALRLWRGPALAGIDSQLVRVAASRLDEQRVTALEDRLTLELDLGRHHEVIGELGELVAEFPLREQLHWQLMLALYRCDRAAEALQVYRRARRTMIDELGIEPGERLQRLERAILTSDPALNPPAGEPVRLQPDRQPVPGLLPADIADFTGRDEQVARIRQHLTRMPGRGDRLAVPVVVISGKGGVGKTSIAVHAAHALAGQFPGGQLFADLHGVSSQPAGPMHVLERFLRALGVPGAQIPEGPDERAEEYRNLLASRRLLVVLDDAVSEGQVLPLLPGSGVAAVLITSRARLTGIAGAIQVDLDVFDADSCVDLLARIIGAERVQAQPDATAEVARHCGRLPLALRIAGARLSARPHWSIRQFAERLADETRRLDELRHGDLAVRVSISLSYESASQQARRLFRRLALLDVPVFSGWLSAALLDQPPAEADDVLDELVTAQLIEVVSNGPAMPARYRLHELIRMFARERLADEEQAGDREAALQRALGALLYLADEANRRYYGASYIELRSDAPRWPLPGRLTEQLAGNPMAWLARERATLVSGARQAARAGFTGLCWSLVFRAIPLFEHWAYFDDWRETADIALKAARKSQDVHGQAVILYSTGLLHHVQGRRDQARPDLEAAARLFRDVADENGLALVTRHIAFLDRMSGRFDDAAARYEQVAGIFRRTGQPVAAAYALLNAALTKLALNELGEARQLLADALQLRQAGRSGRTEERGSHPTSATGPPAEEPAQAAATFEQALAMVRTMGDPVGEAYLLIGVGTATVPQGELGPARAALERALEIADALGHPGIEARAQLVLAELALASGDPRQAATLGQQAAVAFQRMGMPLIHARALGLLSDAYAALGDGTAAAAASAEADALRTANQATHPRR